MSDTKIDEILSRGVVEFIDPDGSFKKKLLNNPEEIIIKYGVDPTRPDIHLGHAVCFRKLRQFQDLGCKVIFLVGDFTAQIGDPTGKNNTRPEIEQKEVEKNLATYLNQIKEILLLDDDYFSWIRNSDWYASVESIFLPQDAKGEISDEFGGKIKVKADSTILKAQVWENTRMQKTVLKKERIHIVTFISFMMALRKITYAKLIGRDMFQDRINKNEQLGMHEVMYPVLQGIDSNVIYKIYGNCDIEIGGTDQTFNMLMGRDMMEVDNQHPQSVISLKLLVGTDGKEKMSKSLDNYIGITEAPNDMFGKVMSIPDTSIINYFELCTDLPMEKIKKVEADMKAEKVNPRDLKLELAGEIVKIYHGEKEAEAAKEYFIKTFSKKEIPENIPEVKVDKDAISLLDFIILSGNATSKGDARRKIEQGGVEIDGKKIADSAMVLDKSFDGKVVKVGKIHFVKVKF